MSVPRRFVGAWERVRLEIGGTDVPGIGYALWIESGGTYVDVRAPGTAASGTSFGGRSTWRSPMFTWHHDLDLHPRPQSVDRGQLMCNADRIVERGSGIGGEPLPYEEHWRRLTAPNGVTAIARHEHGLAVRVGDYAAVVVIPANGSEGRARAWAFANAGWHEEISLGTIGDDPEPRGSGWRLPRNWSAT